MTSPVAALLGACHKWLTLALIGTLLVQSTNTNSSPSQSNQQTIHTNSSAPNSSPNSLVWNKPCSSDSSHECGDTGTGICQLGRCMCVLGYYWTGRECRYKECRENNECYAIWPNTRCSNKLCGCQENFEVDFFSQTCRYHFVSSLKEPYFYGPFCGFVAFVVLLLALWYFCVRKRKQQTTIIFHKGDLPTEFTSNTVATDQIPTISQVQNTPSHPPPSYTPFESQVVYQNQVLYDNPTYRPYPNGYVTQVSYARCASHQTACSNEMYDANGNNEPVFIGNGHTPHFETNYHVQSAMTPPPPPPPPSYTPLSEKVTILT